VSQIKDLDLLNPMRELIYEGKVFRQPEGTISSTWVELNAFLLDNYCEPQLLVTLTCSHYRKDGEVVQVIATGR
jgi:hypothetical protein